MKKSIGRSRLLTPDYKQIFLTRSLAVLRRNLTKLTVIIMLSTTLSVRPAIAELGSIEGALELATGYSKIIEKWDEVNPLIGLVQSEIEDGASEQKIREMLENLATNVSMLADATEAYTKLVTNPKIIKLANLLQDAEVAELLKSDANLAAITKGNQFAADLAEMRKFQKNATNFVSVVNKGLAVGDVAFAGADIIDAYKDLNVLSGAQAIRSTGNAFVSVVAAFGTGAGGVMAGSLALPLGVAAIGGTMAIRNYERAQDGTERNLFNELDRLDAEILSASQTVSDTVFEIYQNGGSLKPSEIDQIINDAFAGVLDLLERSENPSFGRRVTEFLGLRSDVREAGVLNARFLLNTLLDQGRVRERLMRHIDVYEAARSLQSESDLLSTVVREINVAVGEIDLATGAIVERSTTEANLCRGRDCSDIWGTALLSNAVENPQTDQEDTAAIQSITPPSPPVVEDKVTPASVIIDNRILEIQRRRAEEAAQAERALLAEQQRQARLASIAALEAERTKQFLVKLDAEARIKNNDNRLAILNFDEREKVQRVLSVVDTESARLRNLQNTSGISAEDATRLQAIMAYGEVLEAELDRIAAEERTLQGSNTALQSSLATANSIIVNNSNQLNALNYDWNGFTIPSYSANLTDWSTFKYELPPFDLTPTPNSTVKNGFLAAASATPGSTYLITNQATATLPSAGSGQFPVVNTNNGALTVRATNPSSDDYQYLSFGTSSDPKTITETETGIVHSIGNVHWLYGDTTPPAYFAGKTGTANWSGALYGDYALRGTNRTFYHAVRGTLHFSVNFADNSVRGSMWTNVNYELSPNVSVSSSSAFTLQGNFFAGNGPDLLGAGINTQLLSFGNAVQGGLGGEFYGPSGQEFGGTFEYFDDNGGAAGIVVAKPFDGDLNLPPPDAPIRNYSNYRGLAAYDGYVVGTREYVSKIVAVDNVSDTGTVSFKDTYTTRDASQQSVGGKYGAFDYAVWGTWDDEITGTYTEIDGQMISGSRANWVVYDPTVNLQTTGTAKYLGVAYGEGDVLPHGRVNGGISLTANFQDDTVSGTLSLDHSGGGDWLNATFNTNIVRGNGSSGFQGGLQGADVGSGTIFGGFAGPSAEEVAGGWQLSKIDGSYANGIFAAKEQ